VIGAGISGVGLVKLILRLGAEATLADVKKESAIRSETVLPESPRVEYRFGDAFPETLDGHDLLALSPGVPLNHPLVKLAREGNVEVTGELELAVRYADKPYAAVTGSNGKTTCAALAAHILKASGFKPFLGGNIGFGLAELLSSLPAGEGGGCDCLVLEVSSFQLETVERFHAKGAALLNLTPDHLDRHGSMAEYSRMKERIFLNQTEEDVSVLNLDDPALAGTRPGGRLFGFSRRKDPGKSGARLIKRDGRDFIEFHEGGGIVSEEECLGLSFSGPANMENLMAAAGLAHSLGVPLKGIVAKARGFKADRHRLELVGRVNGVEYYDDSKATNTGAVEAALGNFPPRSVYLVMGGRDKDLDFSVLAAAVKRKVKRLLLIGEAAPKIESQLRGSAPAERLGSLEEAVRRAGDLAKAGDAVLLSPACASYDMFKNYKERGEAFQREVLRLKEGSPDDPRETRC
jgi:UDP-N-acetylmuramoylalanine--D-glutamate ligase